MKRVGILIGISALIGCCLLWHGANSESTQTTSQSLSSTAPPRLPEALSAKPIAPKESTRSLEIAAIAQRKNQKSGIVPANAEHEPSYEKSLHEKSAQVVKASQAKWQRLSYNQTANAKVVSDCNNERCQKSQDGYTVAGISYSLGKPADEKVLLHAGDAKRAPLLNLQLN